MAMLTAPTDFTLGERMKQWEHEYRRIVPANQYLLLRLDGRAFHTYTRGLDRPFDTDLMRAMDEAMLALCREIDGALMGYVQSDEISLLVADWSWVEPIPGNPDGLRFSQAWLGGVEAKLLSISAAVASVKFNEVRQFAQGAKGGALFDSRLWTLPNDEVGYDEVRNYFLWRQRDCTKNSVSMAAQAHFSHKQLEGANTARKLQMLSSIGHPWEDLPQGFRTGRIAVRVPERGSVTYLDKRDNLIKTIEVERSPFAVQVAPDFSQPGVLDRVVQTPIP